MNQPLQSLPQQDVPFKITNPERIPAKRYYDEAFYKLECELLWPRVWQMAARLEEIAHVGDWVEYKILDQSVIVVRAKSGVKAFRNVCRHRGMQLASGHGNCEVQGFTCPFHGWRWNIEGENTFVYGRQMFSEENLEAAELNLTPVRCELWGGCAFINLDDDAAPLLDCIKPMADQLVTRNVDKMKMEWWLAADLPVNWKLAMEAFMEGYHLMRTHPQIYELSLPGQDRYGGSGGNFAPIRPPKTSREYVDTLIEHMDRLNVGMAGMIHATDVAIARELRDTLELPDDVGAAAKVFSKRLNQEITRQGRARGAPVPDLTTADPVAPVLFVFPHYFMLPQFGNMSSYRIRPLGPERCLFELWALTVMPEDEEHEPPRAPVPMAHNDPRWPPIPMQDYDNLPMQQLGLHADSFKYMRLSRQVEGLISNYQRLIDGFLGGVGQDKLTAATRVACDALDVPIKDIGF
jgi:phenylpropionate dioxygenase-like ring-hydroxylating dioxygenase large terminal subunit